MGYHEYRTVAVPDKNHRIVIDLPPEMAADEVEVVVSTIDPKVARTNAIMDRIAKNPGGRFQTAEEVNEYLQALRAEWDNDE